jgi:hypothetical protein
MELGVIISASYLVASWDEPTMAAGLLKEFNITEAIIKKIADDHDKELLLPLYDSESTLSQDSVKVRRNE